MLTSSRRVRAHAAPQEEDSFEVDFSKDGRVEAAEGEKTGIDKGVAVAVSSPVKFGKTEEAHEVMEAEEGEQQQEQERQEDHSNNIDYASTVLDSLHTRAESDRRLAEAFTIFSREVSHLMRPRDGQNESLRSEVSSLLRDLEDTRDAQKGAALVIERQEKEKKVAAQEYALRLKASKEALLELRADLEGELAAAHDAFAKEKAAAEKLHSAITLELDAELKRNGQLEAQCEAATKANIEAKTELDDALERLACKEKQLVTVSEAHRAMKQSHEKQCREITTLIKYKDEIGQHVWSLTDKVNELGSALKAAEEDTGRLRAEKATIEMDLVKARTDGEGVSLGSEICTRK